MNNRKSRHQKLKSKPFFQMELNIEIAIKYIESKCKPKNVDIEKFIATIYHKEIKIGDEKELVDKIDRLQLNEFNDVSWELDHRLELSLAITGSSEIVYLKMGNDFPIHLHELKQIGAVFEQHAKTKST